MLSRFDPKILQSIDAVTNYFTCLSLNVYDSLCRYLVPFLKEPRQNLPLQNQITMFLVRCRLNLPLKYLSYKVNLSPSTIHAMFQKNLDLMYYKLNFLISTQDIRKTTPPVFKQYFSKLTNIFDCFEIFIERPKSFKARAEVYSNYKNIQLWSSWFLSVLLEQLAFFHQGMAAVQQIYKLPENQDLLVQNTITQGISY